MNLTGRICQNYKVLAEYKKKFVIACNPKAVQPWVVWNVDRDGDFYGGHYYSDKRSAVSYFRSKGFKGYV